MPETADLKKETERGDPSALPLPDGNGLWEKLRKRKETGKETPIFLYGTGNGADKVLAALEAYGLSPEGFFVSDGFCRGQTFHGKKVTTYSEVAERYGEKNITVLVAFASSLPDVIGNVTELAKRCETYFPDVPVFGDVPEELFTQKYYENRLTDFADVRRLLADERSRTVFDGVVRFRLSGNIDHIIGEDVPLDPFGEMLTEVAGLTKGRPIRSVLDLGAYTGDTAAVAAEVLGPSGDLTYLEAWEPDPKTAAKLTDSCRRLSQESNGRIQFEAMPFAAWKEDGSLTFSASGGRNAGIGAGDKPNPNAPKKKEVSVTARSVDSRRRETGIRYDLIKIDVEGAEKEVLLGAKETISACRPILLLSLYHRTDDLRALPLFLHRHFPDYRFLLRRPRYLPAWDLTLIAY